MTQFRFCIWNMLWLEAPLPHKEYTVIWSSTSAQEIYCDLGVPQFRIRIVAWSSAVPQFRFHTRSILWLEVLQFRFCIWNILWFAIPQFRFRIMNILWFEVPLPHMRYTATWSTTVPLLHKNCGLKFRSSASAHGLFCDLKFRSSTSAYGICCDLKFHFRIRNILWFEVLLPHKRYTATWEFHSSASA